MDSLSDAEMEAYIRNAVLEAQAKKKYVKVEKKYRYRVTLTDKKNCGYSVKHPENFLSAKALARRSRYGLKVDEYDLPVSAFYTRQLSALGPRLHNMSKWNNTVVVETADTMLMARVRQLPFVKATRCVWEGPDSVLVPEPSNRADEVTNRRDTTLHNYYGYGQNQVEMLAVDCLHQAGFRGKGVTIGVVDGGYYNADLMKGFDQSHILGTRNFVRPSKSVYEELDHGMMVLSCMAAVDSHKYMGTAPEAEYLLLRSEYGPTESLYEEDTWAMAAEYADSVGVDVINSSLGYAEFDDATTSHKYVDLDGRRTLISNTASMLAQKGVVLVCSAGNSGRDRWKKVTPPGDAIDVLTVGAVDSRGLNAVFSSIGPSQDGRVKPDIMARGGMARIFNAAGVNGGANGTSFASPIACGMVACLWQALPGKTAKEIISLVRSSADRYLTPDNIYGYGIPDFWRAYQQGR